MVQAVSLKLLAIGFAAVLAVVGVLWSSVSVSGFGQPTRVTHVMSGPQPLPMPGPRPEPVSAMPAGSIILVDGKEAAIPATRWSIGTQRER